ncbi:MAG: Lipoprotein signal peptidase [Bacteroidota bacterium]
MMEWFKLIIYFCSMFNNKRILAAFITIVLILLVDQIFKIYIKTHYKIGDETIIASWFHIHFIENKGMAFGLELEGKMGKLILSTFRILASSGIFYFFIYKPIQQKMHIGFIICMSAIFAGAVGNILDSLYFGLIFNESTPFQLATLFPKDGGYAPFLYGKVVDMLYFPLFEITVPNWVPIIGGKYFAFFDAIFNIADSAITCGVICILLFQAKFFPVKNENDKLPNTENIDAQL